MADFYNIVKEQVSPKKVVIKPDFMYGSDDIIIRGADFYAFWDGKEWSTSINKLMHHIDKETNEAARMLGDSPCKPLYMMNHSSGLMTAFGYYCKNLGTTNIEMDTTIFFKSDTRPKYAYSTLCLNYDPDNIDTPSWDLLVNTWFAEDMVQRIMWYLGALLSKNQHQIQKALYIYGEKRSGKSSVMRIIRMLLGDYVGTFSLRNMVGASSFTDPSLSNKLVLLDEDADVTQTKNSDQLLKITAHEPITVNEKYNKQYTMAFKGQLIMASNDALDLRGLDNGLGRRILVAMTGREKVDPSVYNTCMERIIHELPGIAYKCIQMYLQKGANAYDNDINIALYEENNDAYAFFQDHYDILVNEDQMTLKRLYEYFLKWRNDNEVYIDAPKKYLKREARSFYSIFKYMDRIDGKQYKNVYTGFRKELFPNSYFDATQEVKPRDYGWMTLYDENRLDTLYADLPAQLQNKQGIPSSKWADCKTKLSDIYLKDVHYVKAPENHIVIDLDLKISGKKNLDLNLEKALEFPPTYAEVSKSGEGIHLHYIYNGDVAELTNSLGIDVEVKKFTGGGSIRRISGPSNMHVIETIPGGILQKKVINEMYKQDDFELQNERMLRRMVVKNLAKEYHDATAPSVDYIKKLTDDAYEAGFRYDISDLRGDIAKFATKSTNQATRCVGVVRDIKWRSKDFESEGGEDSIKTDIQVDDSMLVFYDVEVFPNVNIVVYGNKHVGYKRLINPKPDDIEKLIKLPLVGFNNKAYDDHILYAIMLGSSVREVYSISQQIVNERFSYRNAYGLSYTDIYDFSSTKQSLKKWQLAMGITHLENEYPWDEELDESLWDTVADYCENDVISSESLFYHISYDFESRKILAKMSGLTLYDSTNRHSSAIIMKGLKNSDLVYTDLKTVFDGYDGQTYLGEDPSKGGFVWSKPGVYQNVWAFDVASMHPHSAIALNYFGDIGTKRFKNMVDFRMAVKARDHATVERLLYELGLADIDESMYEKLAYSFKIVINSVYGLTCATFNHILKHPNNTDNIIARRGALFMIKLKAKLIEMGAEVVHIKTDCIKVANPSDEIKVAINEMGAEFSYTFEIEDVFTRFALVNDASYVGQLENGKWESRTPMFGAGYTFKTLFSKEELKVEDFRLNKSVNGAMYLFDGDMPKGYELTVGDKALEHVGKAGAFYASKTGFDLKVYRKGAFSNVAGTNNNRPGKKKQLHKFRHWDVNIDLGDVDTGWYECEVAKAVHAISKVTDREGMIILGLENYCEELECEKLVA